MLVIRVVEINDTFYHSGNWQRPKFWKLTEKSKVSPRSSRCLVHWKTKA